MEDEILLKKNQLALILLTLVMMLTVYYIKDPFAKDKDDDGDKTGQVDGRLEQLAEKRLILKNSRKEIILELDAIIASNDATVNEKAAALEQKQALNQLTEKEIMMELDIINKGYQDAFVHATAELITITVVADEHSANAAVEIINMCYLDFGNFSDEVRVQFQTVEQVMGTID